VRKHRLHPSVVFAFFAVLGFSHAVYANSVWITSVTHECTTAPDDTVVVSVMVTSNDNPIDDGTLFISNAGAFYLHFVSGQRGSLISGWANFSATQNSLGGGVTIQMSNATPIPAGSSGEIARLKFTAADCCTGAYSSPSPYKLGLSAIGDFASMNWINGHFMCSMDGPGILYVENGFSGCDYTPKTVKVDVMVLEAPGPIDDAVFDIHAPLGAFQFAGFERGNATMNWENFNVSTDIIGGGTVTRVRVNGSTSTPIPAGTTGTLITINFNMTCCAIPYAYAGYHVLQPVGVTGDLAPLWVEVGRWYCSPVATRPVSWGQVKSLYR
jgi:hypothetical protein